MLGIAFHLELPIDAGGASAAEQIASWFALGRAFDVDAMAIINPHKIEIGNAANEMPRVSHHHGRKGFHTTYRLAQRINVVQMPISRPPLVVPLSEYPHVKGGWYVFPPARGYSDVGAPGSRWCGVELPGRATAQGLAWIVMNDQRWRMGIGGFTEED